MLLLLPSPPREEPCSKLLLHQTVSLIWAASQSKNCKWSALRLRWATATSCWLFPIPSAAMITRPVASSMLTSMLTLNNALDCLAQAPLPNAQTIAATLSPLLHWAEPTALARSTALKQITTVHVVHGPPQPWLFIKCAPLQVVLHWRLHLVM